LLIALKDLNNNQPWRKKKIGFIKHFTIPNDTVYELELFKETLLKLLTKSGIRKSLWWVMKEIWNWIKAKKIIWKTTLPLYQQLSLSFLKKTPTNMVQTNQSRLLALIVTKDSYKDNFSFKIKDQKKDTLSITLFKTAH
jgi:hypothetical protein